MDYQVLREEEIVLILSSGHPLAQKAQIMPGFHHPWIDLELFRDENFILLYPDQNTGGIALNLFQEYGMNPPVLLHTRNSEMSIKLAMDGLGAAFAPESYYRQVASERGRASLCLSVGKRQVLTTTIAAWQKNRYQPQYVRDYIGILRDFCAASASEGGSGE